MRGTKRCRRHCEERSNPGTGGEPAGQEAIRVIACAWIASSFLLAMTEKIQCMKLPSAK
ncbi:MAG: hypothetical protein LBJ47_07570 [Tannerella sp.]|nr:hypothetical protein [Tannerella sp.]